MRDMFQLHVAPGNDLLETDDHKEAWRFYRAQLQDARQDAITMIVNRAVNGNLRTWPIDSIGGLLLEQGLDIETAGAIMDHVQADRDTILIFRFVQHDGRESIFNFPPQYPFTVGYY